MWHRKPVVAGAFYPSNKQKLSDDIDMYLANADIPEMSDDIISVISPHAGYIYSGPVAGYSFNAMKRMKCETAIVLAPSHRGRFKGASVIPCGIYETPLGQVEIDNALCEKLESEDHFGFIKEIDEAEHSLEVQVPFLQKIYHEFTIAPLIIGTTDTAICSQIADTIYRHIKDNTQKYSIVISTDLSHYHPYDEAIKIDNIFIDTLKNMDENSLAKICSTKAEACGLGPLLAGMALSKKLGAKNARVLKYATSGDTAGSKTEVVGYLAAAFVK